MFIVPGYNKTNCGLYEIVKSFLVTCDILTFSKSNIRMEIFGKKSTEVNVSYPKQRLNNQNKS